MVSTLWTSLTVDDTSVLGVSLLVLTSVQWLRRRLTMPVHWALSLMMSQQLAWSIVEEIKHCQAIINP